MDVYIKEILGFFSSINIHECMINALELVKILFYIGVIAFLLKLWSKYFPRQLDSLKIHLEPAFYLDVDEDKVTCLRSSDGTIKREHKFKFALRIVIKNTGSNNVYLSTGTLKPRYNAFLFFSRKSKLKFSPNAFKDANSGSYELKFGDEYISNDILIKPAEAIDTIIPLTKGFDVKLIEKKKIGLLSFYYSSGEKYGLHKQWI